MANEGCLTKKNLIIFSITSAICFFVCGLFLGKYSPPLDSRTEIDAIMLVTPFYFAVFQSFLGGNCLFAGFRSSGFLFLLWSGWFMGGLLHYSISVFNIFRIKKTDNKEFIFMTMLAMLIAFMLGIFFSWFEKWFRKSNVKQNFKILETAGFLKKSLIVVIGMTIISIIFSVWLTNLRKESIRITTYFSKYQLQKMLNSNSENIKIRMFQEKWESLTKNERKYMNKRSDSIEKKMETINFAYFILLIFSFIILTKLAVKAHHDFFHQSHTDLPQST